MKGIVHIIEVLVTGTILVLAFMFFFPQYSIKSKWDSVLLAVKVRDTINTIDRMNKTYDFAASNVEFDNFMTRIFQPEKAGGVVVWWKVVEGDIQTDSYNIPYFTEGYRESIVDVYNTTSDGYHVYSFTLGMGYPY